MLLFGTDTKIRLLLLAFITHYCFWVPFTGLYVFFLLWLIYKHKIWRAKGTSLVSSLDAGRRSKRFFRRKYLSSVLGTFVKETCSMMKLPIITVTYILSVLFWEVWVCIAYNISMLPNSRTHGMSLRTTVPDGPQMFIRSDVFRSCLFRLHVFG